MNPSSQNQPAVLYCHCRYARVVPPEIKNAVLEKLCASNLPFEAVTDLCELSARRDPSLKRLAAAGPLKIAACFPRAVKWLFAAADAPLSPECTQVSNMRTETAEAVCHALLSSSLAPNLPATQAASAGGSGIDAKDSTPNATPVS